MLDQSPEVEWITLFKFAKYQIPTLDRESALFFLAALTELVADTEPYKAYALWIKHNQIDTLYFQHQKMRWHTVLVRSQTEAPRRT